MKVKKVTVRGPDKVLRDYWMADLRYKGNGKRRFFDKKEEATAYLEQHGRLHRTRRRTPTDKPTVGEFVTMLLEKRRGTCAEATFDVDRTQLGHFMAYEVRPGVPLRDVRLDTLDGDNELILDVLRWQSKGGNRWPGKSYAADSVRLLRNAIKRLFDRAVSQGYILQHPLRDPETLKDIRGLFKTLREARPEKVRAMTAEQARKFLEKAAESPLYPLFAVGFGCGPRLGELLALQPGDDVVRVVEGERRRQLHICRALPQRMSRKNPQPKRLKNGADYYVDIPKHVGVILDAHKNGGRYEFHTKNGTPYSHEHVQGEFKRLVKLAWPKQDENDPKPPEWDFTPHSMRHTFATLHILANKPAKWVSRQLGHADVTVTLKIYARWFEMVCPGAADEHGERLFGEQGADGNGVAKPAPVVTEEAAPTLH